MWHSILRERHETGQYAKLIHEIEQLKEEHLRLTELAAMLDGVVTAAALQLDDEQQNSLLVELHREAVHTRDKITNIVCGYNILRVHVALALLYVGRKYSREARGMQNKI